MPAIGGYVPKKRYRPSLALGGTKETKAIQEKKGTGRFKGGAAYSGSGRRTASSSGGAPPPSAGGGAGAFTGGSGGGYDSRVAPNPYLDKVFNRFEGLFNQSQDLYGKALDPTAALENYKDLRAQGMKEAVAQAGGRGFAPGTGMSLAQTQDALSRSQQGEQELAADWQNRGLEFQKGLLGTMGQLAGGAGGVGGQIGQEQLGWGQQGLNTQRHLLDSWYKTQMLPIEMEKAKNANLATQISAISSLGSLF